MAKPNPFRTYQQLNQEIQRLKVDADRLKREEVEGVIARIREAIDVYGLTAGDLGLGVPQRARRPAPVTASKRSGSKKRRALVTYADGQGNTWGGMGPRPRWLRTALEAGAPLESFAVSPSSAT